MQTMHYSGLDVHKSSIRYCVKHRTDRMPAEPEGILELKVPAFEIGNPINGHFDSSLVVGVFLIL